MYKTGSSDKLTEQEVMNCWGQPRFCLVDNTTMFVMTIIVITIATVMKKIELNTSLLQIKRVKGRYFFVDLFGVGLKSKQVSFICLFCF